MRLFQEDADESLQEMPQAASYEHRVGKVKLESTRRKERKISERLLTIVQVSVCGVLLLAALVVKLLGGDAYQAVKDWYYQTLNQSIVAQEQLDGVRQAVWSLFPPSSSVSSPDSSITESSQCGAAASAASTVPETSGVPSEENSATESPAP
ncbi:hypothetical protein [Hydrogeniiclostridium mannosilyticum]|uniref:hypothetical protein n=1 Tax=Hydrogeniiclostridium mannosilyticum TaxID=2764322 RepID=UPI00399B626D